MRSPWEHPSKKPMPTRGKSPRTIDTEVYSRQCPFSREGSAFTSAARPYSALGLASTRSLFRNCEDGSAPPGARARSSSRSRHPEVTDGRPEVPNEPFPRARASGPCIPWSSTEGRGPGARVLPHDQHLPLVHLAARLETVEVHAALERANAQLHSVVPGRLRLIHECAHFPAADVVETQRHSLTGRQRVADAGPTVNRVREVLS